MSSATITPDSLRCQNESIAANLTSLFPTTPTRPTPNSAKKRKQMPDLSRPFATPGHGAKMSMIFRNAATSLQGNTLPNHQPLSNIKKSRLPFSQARGTKSRSTYHDDILVSSVPGIPPEMSQHSGGSCRHQASGTSPHCPTPIPWTKASQATIGTLTNQCLDSASSVGGIFLDGSLVASSPLRIEEESREPISSGVSTPVVSTPDCVETPEQVKYPILEKWRSLRSSSNAYSHGSDSDDLHSTRGVPFILHFPGSDADEAPRSDIDTWLNGILEVPLSKIPSSPKQLHGRDGVMNDDSPFPQSRTSNVSSPTRTQVSPSKFKQAWRTPLRASSNKENTSPSKYSSSPIRPPAPRLRKNITSRFCRTNNQPALQNAEAVHCTDPLTPQSHLSLPPKRKRACVSGVVSSSSGIEISTARRDFTIHEDHISEALAQLSPDVERHRKGRGPKRERCTSYWDEDILHPGPIEGHGDGEKMGKAKKVLGQSK